MTGAPTSVAAPAAKLDPETLVLRGSPARVTRFRRGAIVGIAAASSVAVFGITWLALKPASLNLVPSGDERFQVAGSAPPDALAGSPSAYDEVPQLGPPLPGDLGRPILKHRQQIEAAGQLPRAETADKAAQAAEAERQRLATERRSARESGIMMQLASNRPTSILAAGLTKPAELSGSGGAPIQSADPAGQQRKIGLVGLRNDAEDTNPHPLVPAQSPYMLSAGSVLAASLITGLNSDIPGLVTAQVTENAYDSATGRILLVPQGSRLIGSYDSVIAFGQSRALVVWQRLILPDGSSIRIDNVPATDLAGYAGLSDRVDRHSWQLLKGIGLSTLLGVGTELSFGSNEGNLVEALRQSAQSSGVRAGDQLISRNLDVQPTIRVRPGWPLRVVVHKDIILKPWPGPRF